MWNISYLYNGERTDFHDDASIGNPTTFPNGKTEADAIASAKEYIIEQCRTNGFCVEVCGDVIRTFKTAGEKAIGEYSEFRAEKRYQLLNENGKPYLSQTPGTFGGHKRLKIYGRLDCPSAARYIAKGEYVKHRVFFLDEETAISAGYRPCGVCMKAAYKKWKEEQMCAKS